VKTTIDKSKILIGIFVIWLKKVLQKLITTVINIEYRLKHLYRYLLSSHDYNNLIA
jgi:hypothetical protein